MQYATITHGYIRNELAKQTGDMQGIYVSSGITGSAYAGIGRLERHSKDVDSVVLEFVTDTPHKDETAITFTVKLSAINAKALAQTMLDKVEFIETPIDKR
jgi:hypothetical protein